MIKYAAFIVKGNRTREITNPMFVNLCARYGVCGSYLNNRAKRIILLRAADGSTRSHSIMLVSLL